ncbi:MAG: cadherin-like domain-containing protein [Actinomycetaceae bacterium]|nr:cadherin-like domain-containing protein [Actinomycetaceae bacterium]
MAVSGQSSWAKKRNTGRNIMAAIGVLVVCALAIVGISATKGTTEQEVKVARSSVWALRSGGSSFYGAINTEIAELSSVHSGNSSTFQITGVIQNASHTIVYSNQNMLVVDEKNPVSVDSQDVLPAKPLGADKVVTAGEYVAFLNQSSGSLGVTTIDELAKGATVSSVNEKAENASEEFVSATVTESGILYGITSLGTLVSYDVKDGKREDTQTDITIPDNAISVDMSVFQEDHWGLLIRDEQRSYLWVDGKQSDFTVTGVGALANSSESASHLVIADQSGLHELNTDGVEERSQTNSTLSAAVPASPYWMGGCVYAAWTTGSSAMISSCGGNIEPLEYPSSVNATNSTPTLRANGQQLILNDTTTGLVWEKYKNEWKFVQSSLQWEEDAKENDEQNEQQNQDASSNECPSPAVGRAAEFGVRPGQATNISVLASALDPNADDTITIIPSENSPHWKGDGIGELSLTNNNQSVSLTPSATSGSGTFTYTITDGSGNCSVQAEAQVSVHGDDVRSKPEYRSAQEDYLNHLQVAPGGSLTFDGLAGWVDPDGDPLYISGVSASAGTVAATPQGTVAYQADDDQEAGEVQIAVTVADGHGDGSSTQNFNITVSESPAVYARSFARSVPTSATQKIELSQFISGVSVNDARTARAELVSADVEDEQLKQNISIVKNSDELSLIVTPTQEGVYPIKYKVESGTSTATGTVLVNSFAANTKLSVPPLTVFLRPNEDVTIDPLELATQSSDGVVMVRDAQSQPAEGAALTAEAIAGSTLRFSGQTANNSAGRIGSASYTITDGEESATGYVTVFELDDSASTKPVTITDQVTVRAGSQVDIPVLNNDIPAAGTTLTLDATQSVDDETGLSFSSDTTLRYLAPTEPGYYTLFYTAYAQGYSDEKTQGRVNVHVIGDGTNKAPEAQLVQARVEARNSTLITIPTFGVDPDGDDLVVSSVTQPAEHGSAQLLSDGRIRITSTDESGPIEFEYTLMDSQGATSTAQVKVGVIVDTPRAPVAYNDYVEVKPGVGTVTINPTLNDRTVGSQKLVVEDVALQPLNNALDNEEVTGEEEKATATVGEDNMVTLQVPEEAGKLIYRYTLSAQGDDTAEVVQGTENEGTKAEGIIVVNALESALPIYPIVRDTYISSDDINNEDYSADVLTNKVVWSGSPLMTRILGDVDANLNNNRIEGSLTEARQIIVFEVAGTTPNNEDVKTWGFVRVPQTQTVVPELKNPTHVYEVNQGETLDINMLDAVADLAGRTLEVSAARTSGGRQGANCIIAGNVLQYRAGDANSGEYDACLVTVKWQGYDKSVTQISLPIHIVLADPPPSIVSQQVAVVDPGQTTTYDLRQSVSWRSDKDFDSLAFACGNAVGAQGVTITCNGSTATISADVTAQQGATAVFDVRITSGNYPQGAPTGRLRIKVGTLAPLSLNPRGTSLTIDTAQSRTATTDDLVAMNQNVRHYGELSLVAGSVSFPSNSGLSGQVVGNTVQVTAGQNAYGGTWNGSVRIQDSQKNSGVISISVTVSAAPPTPTLALQTAGDGYVVVRITSGGSSNPPVEYYNVVWSGAGGNGSKHCSEGTCRIDDLTNFENITVTVTAHSSKGDSEATRLTGVYAYGAPIKPTISWEGAPRENDHNGVAYINVDMGVASGQKAYIYYSANDGSGMKPRIQVTKSGEVKLTGIPNGKANATRVYAEARSSVNPPAALQVPSTLTSRSNEITVWGVGVPQVRHVATNTSGKKIISRFYITTNADGAEYQWYVNGQASGTRQRITSDQEVRLEIDATIDSSVTKKGTNNITLEVWPVSSGTVFGSSVKGTSSIETKWLNDAPTDTNGITYFYSGTELWLAKDSTHKKVSEISKDNCFKSPDGQYYARVVEAKGESVWIGWFLIDNGNLTNTQAENYKKIQLQHNANAGIAYPYNASGLQARWVGSHNDGSVAINGGTTEVSDALYSARTTIKIAVDGLPSNTSDYELSCQASGSISSCSIDNGVITLENVRGYAGAQQLVAISVNYKNKLGHLGTKTQTIIFKASVM